MDKLKKILLDEIEEFRKQGHEFCEGKMSVMDFKKISGGMGAYAHRGGEKFMVRIRTPSGITHVDELKFIYDMGKKYNLEKIHLTTRQAVQFHDISIDDVCEIMKEGLEHNIYTRGAGGNYPRNVAMSPLAGVDRYEAFDVTPYALAVNNHFLRKINTYNLPRKIKVSFSSSNMDCGHSTVTDLGFLAVVENDKKYFKVYIGGGLGRNPKLGIAYDELIDPSEVLYHVEAMTNLFMAEGDYENKNKARIRYILDRMGPEEFLNCYKKYLKEVKNKEDLTLHLYVSECNKEGIEIDLEHNRLYEQKQKGLYSVYFHPIGGQLYLKDLKLIIDEIENIKDVEIRLTMTEGMYIRNLDGEEAKRLLESTKDLGGETTLEQSISCIGVPTCQMGILNSQGTLDNILKYFKEKNYRKDVLPRVHISGCGNSCGVHEVALIGFTGKKKRVNDETRDAFELHINGSFEEGNTRLGKVYGDILAEDVPEFLYELALLLEKDNINFHDYLKSHEEEFEALVNKFEK
ncbi:TPA: nitrite/sulfite reductase [Clostridium botulinum]|nr:nitrite/sulfite reductase [Clostridium botulinum]HBJ1653395.1 nitrite/sulfite reductase [Clostridium botulinum]